MRIIAILTSVLLLISCGSNNTAKEHQIAVEEEIAVEGFPTVHMDSILLEDGIPIYYNMYLTVELASLFEAEGAAYDGSILNTTEKVNEYLTSVEKAMNLGVYAVDLTYARVFEQYQKAGRFFTAMYTLTEELGIPESFIESSADRIEKNITNKDSLNAIANEIYYTTDDYLKANERDNASALIIVGGWIEAIYLASEIFDVKNENEDYEYIQRLEEQKHSLEQLMCLLAGYDNDEAITAILKKLEHLKPYFDAFKYDKNNISACVDQIEAINIEVTKIRNEIIN